MVTYTAEMSGRWDEFVEGSKNGTFLFKRSFMDYHSDRFPDTSLIFEKKGNIIALLPATIKDNILSSHAGLTYGGLIMNQKTTVEDVMEIFDLIIYFCRREGLNGILYKPVPYIYSKLPSQEDLYGLFRHGAALYRRDISSAITRSVRPKMSELRKRCIKKAQTAGNIVMESEDLESFYGILSRNLKIRYGVDPVHSLEELTLLRSRFPDNIKLFATFEEETMTAGTLCFITDKCVHTQYISASERGKETGALDLLFDVIIQKSLEDHSFFDFGISTEKGGTYLNENLIHQKEGFGGRGICYDTYMITL